MQQFIHVVSSRPTLTSLVYVYIIIQQDFAYLERSKIPRNLGACVTLRGENLLDVLLAARDELMTSLFANLFFCKANMMESEKNSPGVAMKYEIHWEMERSRRTGSLTEDMDQVCLKLLQ
jgi:hypothetical protein